MIGYNIKFYQRESEMYEKQCHKSNKTGKKTAVECFGGNMNDTRRRKINIKSTRHSDAAGVTFSENVGL